MCLLSCCYVTTCASAICQARDLAREVVYGCIISSKIGGVYTYIHIKGDQAGKQASSEESFRVDLGGQAPNFGANAVLNPFEVTNASRERERTMSNTCVEVVISQNL